MWGRCWQDGREGLKLMGRISTGVVVVAVTKGLGRIMCWSIGENAIILLPESLLHRPRSRNLSFWILLIRAA